MKRGACGGVVLMALLVAAHADPSPVVQDPAIVPGPGSAGSAAPAADNVIRTTCPGMETRMQVNFALTPP
jgi:hypothetical protein